MLKILINYPDFIQKLKNSDFGIKSLKNESIRKIYNVILSSPNSFRDIKDLIILLQDDAEAVSIVSRLASEEMPGNPEVVFNDCLKDIFKREFKRRQEEIKNKIKIKEAQGQDISDLLSEFQSIIRQAQIKGCM